MAQLSVYTGNSASAFFNILSYPMVGFIKKRHTYAMVVYISNTTLFIFQALFFSVVYYQCVTFSGKQTWLVTLDQRKTMNRLSVMSGGKKK